MQVAQLLNFLWEPTIIKSSTIIFAGERVTKPSTKPNAFSWTLSSDGHNKIDNWEITVTNHAERVKALEKRSYSGIANLKLMLVLA